MTISDIKFLLLYVLTTLTYACSQTSLIKKVILTLKKTICFNLFTKFIYQVFTFNI